MSNAPYLLPKARSGYRMGHQEVIDHMFRDGLQSPFDGKMMGHFADATAAKYGFTRAQQDAFATESVRRALRAVQGGDFSAEIAAVTVRGRKGESVVDRDETPFTCDVEKIQSLKPAFNKDGTVTAASSSSISDGAAALVLMSESAASARGLKPLARIVGYTSQAQAPEWFTTAPGRRDPEAARAPQAGSRGRSTCMRSTRRSPASRWLRCTMWISNMRV